MNFFQIINLGSRFYSLKTKFDQIRRGDFQLPPLVIEFLKETDEVLQDAGKVVKELSK